MELVDVRRLTGINLHDASPGAVARVRFAPDEDADAALTGWHRSLAQGLEHLGWDAATHVRRIVDEGGHAGAELMFTARVDRLYAATELNTWAVARTNGTTVADRPALDALEAIGRQAGSEQASYGCALELIQCAESANVPWLIDETKLSLGYGRHGRTWMLADLARPARDVKIEWPALGRIPVGLVTGTNGKTTTTRLLARIARLAGLRVGNSSTDGLYVDETLVDSGDWTGPGAARELLRRTDLDIAVLEAARGGLLRRGIEVSSCDVALVTNVERDHMGEYGIHDLADMAAAKGLVARAVRSGGRVVFGADSPALVDWADRQHFTALVEWVSPNEAHPRLERHTRDGGTVWTENDGLLVRRRGSEETVILPTAEAPLTFAGKARHNVANVLSAVAGAQALGLPMSAIVAGLREFGLREEDNPGRARVWSLPGGPTLVIDFAHNLAGLTAMAELVRSLGRSTVVTFGMAGDRPDEDLRSLGGALASFNPRHVVLRDQQAYLRGRALGEVPALLEEGLRARAVSCPPITFTEDEPSALDAALAAARPDDLIVLLLHTERESVAAWLRHANAQPATLV